MNDFTKDELLDLYCIVEEFCQTDGIITSEVATKLAFRIQSMIDNYCEREHESRWIDINDELPRMSHVLACCQSYPSNFVSVVRFEQRHTGKHYFWDDSLDKKANVTHWMPLPEGPE